MTPADVFSPAIYSGFWNGSECEPHTSYWLVEMALADVAGIPYTNLSERGNEEQRTCEICGTVYGTDAYGRPQECSHPVCAPLREYWQYEPELRRPSRKSGKWLQDEESRKRCAWFTKNIRDKFGVSSIFQLEPAIRLDALLTLRLLREAHEYQHSTC